jgi:hypothetical protein
MSEQRRFGADRSDVLLVVTTEQFTLQTARSAAGSEITGRAGMFLSTVSIALLAFAFIGQTAGADAAFSLFAVIALLTLLFLGIVTFDRTLQASVDDIALTHRLNRLRKLYVEVFPELGDYLLTTVPSGGVAARLRERLRPTHWQLLLSVAGLVGVINSLIAGLLVGLIADRTRRLDVVLAAVAGAVTFVVSAAIHQRIQVVRRVQPDAPDNA